MDTKVPSPMRKAATSVLMNAAAVLPLGGTGCCTVQPGSAYDGRPPKNPAAPPTANSPLVSCRQTSAREPSSWLLVDGVPPVSACSTAAASCEPRATSSL